MAASRFLMVMLSLALLLAMVPGPGTVSAADTASKGPIEQVEEILDLTQQMVDLTVQALDLYWTDWFLDNDLEEPWVLIQTLGPDDSWTSNCILATGDQLVVTGLMNNAMYCGVDSAEDASGNLIDGVIILPLFPLAAMAGGNMWGRGQIPPGNYAPVAMIAHEFSHHVQDEIARQTGSPWPENPGIELLADCLAGRFLGIWNDAEPLADEQIDAILLGWGFIGDLTADQQSHGTPGQRRFALGLGFNSGEDAPEACMDQYWPDADL